MSTNGNRRPQPTAPAFHIVLGIALVLALPQLWNFVNNQATLTATLLVAIGALIASWAGCKMVKTIVTRYLPQDSVHPLEPYELTGGPTYQPPPGVVPNGNGSAKPPTPLAGDGPPTVQQPVTPSREKPPGRQPPGT